MPFLVFIKQEDFATIHSVSENSGLYVADENN